MTTEALLLSILICLTILGVSSGSIIMRQVQFRSKTLETFSLYVTCLLVGMLLGRLLVRFVFPGIVR